MTDIVNDLVTMRDIGGLSQSHRDVMASAANEIERLRKELKTVKADNMRLMDEISFHENRD